MSLMRNSISPFVATQLGIREKILSLGDSNSRFGSISMGGLELPRGAFYSYAVSKQATIRMYSGVDIQPGTFPKYKDEITGVSLAKQFLLEGGAGTDFTFNEIKKGKDVLRGEEDFNTLDQKSGFARAGGTGWNSQDKLYTGAYGNTHFRANPQKGYGIVPMPGIIDADIRTVSDFGSLRLAKVNFVCHNLPQLEVLEMLYMRPGYPILVEWGWTPYISNITGKLENDLPYFDGFWDKDSNLFEMHTKLIKLKKKRSANYDGVLGFVKNFEFNARHDGGFDCFTEVMGYGEIMQGIQGRNEVPIGGYYDSSAFKTGKIKSQGVYIPESSTKSSTKNNATRIEAEKSIVPNWILGTEDSAANLDNFAWIISALAHYTRPVTYTNGVDHLPTEINKDDYKKATGWDGTAITRKTNSFERAADQVIKYIAEINPNTDYERAARDIADNYCVNGSYFNNTSFQMPETPTFDSYEEYVNERDKESVDITKYHADSGDAHKYEFTDTVFLRWDFLVEIMNKFVINQHKNSKDESAITKYTVFESDASYQDVALDAEIPDYGPHPLQGERRWDLGSYIGMAGPPLLDYRLQKDLEEIGKDNNLLRDYQHYSLLGPGYGMLSYSFDPSICIFPGQTVASHGLLTAGGVKSGTKQADPFSDTTLFLPGHRGYINKETTTGGSTGTATSNTTAYSNKYGNSDEGNKFAYAKPLRIPRGNYEAQHPSTKYQNTDIPNDNLGSPYRSHLGITNRYIGLIYIEYKWLINLWKKEYKKKDFSYFNFWSLVWKEIGQNACAGNHEFILHTDETNSTIRVVDLQNDPTKKPPSKIHSFRVQDKGSIVRDFSFQSSIPDSISATIAIAAQSPDSFNNDTTTLSAFSNNIKSRFSNFIGEKENTIMTYSDLIRSYMIKHHQISNYMYYIHTGWWFVISKKMIATNKGLVKEVIKLIHQLNNIQPIWVNTNDQDSLICDLEGDPHWDNTYDMGPQEQAGRRGRQVRFDNFCKYANPTWESQGSPVFDVPSLNAQNTALIPINVSLSIDGISGIRIGDVVKINNPTGFERLPKAYQRDDVYWVVMGDSHKITSGQDWEQELTLQLTLIGDLEYGHQKSAVAKSVKAAVKKEEKVLVDALGNPRARGPVRQPAGWINPVAQTSMGYANSSTEYDFGERTIGDGFHNGVDIQPRKDKNGGKKLGIYMPKQGKIVKITSGAGLCGNLFRWKFTSVGADEPKYGQFCHLKEFNEYKDGTQMKVGQTINQGERVGTMGTTGGVGLHLHYSLNMTTDFTNPSELTNGVDPSYFLSDEDNVTDFISSLTINPYDIDGLRKDIKEYIEYTAEMSTSNFPEHQKADAIKTKKVQIIKNFGISEPTLAQAISEYQSTGTLSEANYPNLQPSPTLGDLKP